MNEIKVQLITIRDEFWSPRLTMNNESALLYQWEQLERTGCIDNFRIVAGEKKGFRRGFFYSDSDAHKWAEATALGLSYQANNILSQILENYINLLEKVQTPDGYLYTYNQFHFPERRWKNLQIEHELYCLGHLIEAAVSYTQNSNDLQNRFLKIAQKAADLIVSDFMNSSNKNTPGHQEIEIALFRLYNLTKKESYFLMAKQFLEKRGQMHFFGIHMIFQALNQWRRMGYIKKQIDSFKFKDDNIHEKELDLTENLHGHEPRGIALRSVYLFLSGKYNQQHTTIRKMIEPVGHSVRWGYLFTAIAMYFQTSKDASLLTTLISAWDHMVTKRMYITGGIGSLPVIEGFGRDYELNNEFAYCETCASIGSIFWSWEMLKITMGAQYADMIEWQLYNGASVGISLDGHSYLYRNPLESEGALSRRSWYATPCCPSNISRLWAKLDNYLYTIDKNNLWIHQYFGNDAVLEGFGERPLRISMESNLPFEGNISIDLHLEVPYQFTLKLRIPSWVKSPQIMIDSEIISLDEYNNHIYSNIHGYDPYTSFYVSINRKWNQNTKISLNFPIQIRIHDSHPNIKSNLNKVAITRGPLVYCLEGIDNPEVALENIKLNLKQALTDEKTNQLFPNNPIYIINGKNLDDTKLKFIPYYCWANRKQSYMQVWIKSATNQ